MDGLLTTKQVAELFQVSRRTVIRWRDNGTLPPVVRIGRCVRWRRSDIDGFVADGCLPHYKTSRGCAQ